MLPMLSNRDDNGFNRDAINNAGSINGDNDNDDTEFLDDNDDDACRTPAGGDAAGVDFVHMESICGANSAGASI